MIQKWDENQIRRDNSLNSLSRKIQIINSQEENS